MKKCEYEIIFNLMIELEKPEVYKIQKDCSLLRKYEIMEMYIEGIIVQKFVRSGTEFRHVCAEDLATGYGGRNIFYKSE